MGKALLGTSLTLDCWVGENDLGGVSADDGLRLLRDNLARTTSRCFWSRLRYETVHSKITMAAQKILLPVMNDDIVYHFNQLDRMVYEAE